VRRDDGAAISLGKVVTQLSAYMIVHQRAILESKAAFLQMSHEVIDDVHAVGIPAYEDVEVDPHTQVLFGDYTEAWKKGAIMRYRCWCGWRERRDRR
jgi:hypothetical protein